MFTVLGVAKMLHIHAERPLTLYPSPRAFQHRDPSARGEGRERGAAFATIIKRYLRAPHPTSCTEFLNLKTLNVQRSTLNIQRSASLKVERLTLSVERCSVRGELPCQTVARTPPAHTPCRLVGSLAPPDEFGASRERRWGERTREPQGSWREKREWMLTMHFNSLIIC